MFAWGFQPPLCHPTKGGNKDSILEWIGLGFNSQQWVPIKWMFIKPWNLTT